MNDNGHSPENVASIDCPNARLPMSYAQPLKAGAILPPWTFRLHRGIRLYKTLWACSATGIWMLCPKRVQSRRSNSAPITSGPP
jgi:hypothetical protein